VVGSAGVRELLTLLETRPYASAAAAYRAPMTPNRTGENPSLGTTSAAQAAAATKATLKTTS
jgi:hypothetical protein